MVRELRHSVCSYYYFLKDRATAASKRTENLFLAGLCKKPRLQGLLGMYCGKTFLDYFMFLYTVMIS